MREKSENFEIWPKKINEHSNEELEKTKHAYIGCLISWKLNISEIKEDTKKCSEKVFKMTLKSSFEVNFNFLNGTMYIKLANVSRNPGQH